MLESLKSLASPLSFSISAVASRELLPAIHITYLSLSPLLLSGIRHWLLWQQLLHLFETQTSVAYPLALFH